MQEIRFNDSEGFTLVEMLVTIIIISFVLIGMYSVYTQTLTIWKRTDTRSDVQQTTQVVTEELSREVRRATKNDSYPVIISNGSVRFFYSSSGSTYSYIRYRYDSGGKRVYRDSINSPTSKPSSTNWSNNDVDWQNQDIVADNISGFTLTPSVYTFSSTSAYESFRVEISTARPGGVSGNEESTSVVTKIDLRNY